MKLKRKKKSHWRRRRKWNAKRICIIKEVKIKERGNKGIREDEEDPDIAEIEEAIPDIDEDNDGMSKACNFKNPKKNSLTNRQRIRSP